MPEEFGFEEGLGDGRTVDRHKGLIASRPAAMDRAGNDFLARSAFSADQHVGLAVGNLGDQLANAPNHGTVSDDCAISAVTPQLPSKSLVFTGEKLLLQRLFDHDPQLVHLEGLRDVIVCAFFHRGDGGLGTRECSDHDDDGFGRHFVCRVDEINPGAPRHLDVADHDIEFIVLEMHECGIDIPCGDDVVALASEEDLEELLHTALVVNDENAGLRAQTVSPVRGSRIRTVVPTPNSLSNRTLPPWFWTIR